MSLSCPPARRGHRAHTAPAGKTRSASAGQPARYLPGSAEEREDHVRRPVLVRGEQAGGRLASSQPSGGESRPTRSPALSPSLRACGVPVMPGYGTGTSWCAAANERSASVRSASLTSRTRSTCRPTGHHWTRQ